MKKVLYFFDYLDVGIHGPGYVPQYRRAVAATFIAIGFIVACVVRQEWAVVWKGFVAIVASLGLSVPYIRLRMMKPAWYPRNLFLLGPLLVGSSIALVLSKDACQYKMYLVYAFPPGIIMLLAWLSTDINDVS